MNLPNFSHHFETKKEIKMIWHTCKLTCQGTSIRYWLWVIYTSLWLKLKWCSCHAYADLQLCPFRPVIRLAGPHSRNCWKGFEGCRDSMPFSFKQPDLLAGKMPRRSHRLGLWASFLLIQRAWQKDFCKHFYQFLVSSWVGKTDSKAWNHAKLLVRIVVHCHVP